MTIFNRVLLMQLRKMYQKQGLTSLTLYLLNVFNCRVIKRYCRGSYSQKGEDLIINKYFNFKTHGFYIDVGASHPRTFSNTKLFYDKGWRGINIEPSPDSIDLFSQDRERDTNLNIGIGSQSENALFYEFEAAAVSTFSQTKAQMLLDVGYKLRRTIDIQVYRLKEIMDQYPTSTIDFMSVDTEGFEIDVLQSNDWDKYRPQLLCIETIDFVNLLRSGTGDSGRKDSIDKYLLSQGYEEYFSNGLNTLYRDINV